jgi:site-specific DNA recombinase
VKKQLSLLKTKIETIEERFAIGEIENDIYTKINTKYKEAQRDLESNLFNSTISSSNLQMAIDKGLKISYNLCDTWTCGDLGQ